MKKLLITLMLAAAGPVLAQNDAAPEAAGTTSVAEPAGPRISKFGEAVFREEFVHRRKMGDLSRELEVETILTQIEQQRISREKAKSDVKAEMASGIPVNVVPPNATRFGPYATPAAPAQQQRTAAVSEAPAEAIATPKPPKAVGLIGDSVLFSVDKQPLVAHVGDPVGEYQVDAINGRFITLKLQSDPALKTTVQVP